MNDAVFFQSVHILDNSHTTGDDVLQAIPEAIATGTRSNVIQAKFDDFDSSLITMPIESLLVLAA